MNIQDAIKQLSGADVASSLTGYTTPEGQAQVDALNLAQQKSLLQEKIARLEQSRAAKEEKLGLTRGQQIAQRIEEIDKSKYSPAMLESIPDADSLTMVGATKENRLGGDPTMPTSPSGWIDAPEAYHGKFSESDKEQARVAKQMQQYGVTTPEEVYKLNETARLQTLYDMMGRPKGEDGKEWTPGPIEYDAKNDPVMLGSKELPLNVPVSVYDTGEESYGRKVQYVADQTNKYVQNAELAKQGMLYEPDTVIEQPKTSTDFIGTLRDTLKQRESGGDYAALEKKNQNYVGAYQFGTDRLIDLGLMKPEYAGKPSAVHDPKAWTGKYGAKDLQTFLANPELQDVVATEHIEDYTERLSKTATSDADLAGKVAAAHLLGADGAKNLNNVDGNNTSGTEYYNLGANAIGGAKREMSTQEKAIEALRTGSWVNDPVKEEDVNRFTNLVKAVPYAATKLAHSLADATAEMFGKGFADTIRLVDDKNKVADWLDKVDFGTEEEKSKVAQEISGYSKQFSQEAQTQIKGIIGLWQNRELKEEDKGIVDKSFENIAEVTKKVPFVNQLTEMANNVNKLISVAEPKEVIQALEIAIKNPETTIESSAEIIALILGRGKGITTLNKDINSLNKIIAVESKGGKLPDPVKVAELDKLNAQRTSVDKLASVISNNYGTLAVSASYVNDSEDEFIKNEGREKTYLERIGDLAVTTLAFQLDKTVAVSNLKGVKEVAKQVSELKDHLPDNKLVKLMYTGLASSSKLGAAGAKEFFQELTQEGQQAMLAYDLVNDDFTAKEVNPEVIEKLAEDALAGAISGFGGGVHMATPTVALDLVKDIKSTIGNSSVKENIDKTDSLITTPTETIKTYTDDELNAILDTAEPIFKKRDAGEILTADDISNLYAIKDIIPEIKKMEPEWANMLTDNVSSTLKKHERDSILTKLDSTVLNSKQDLLDLMDEVMPSNADEIDAELEDRLVTLASKAGIFDTVAESSVQAKDINAIEDFTTVMPQEELTPYIKSLVDKQQSITDGKETYTPKEELFIARYDKEINEFQKTIATETIKDSTKVKEAFATIKKDFYSVGEEVREGKKGYITQSKELDALLGAQTVNKKAVTKRVSDLHRLLDAENRWIGVISPLLEDAKSKVKTYNTQFDKARNGETTFYPTDINTKPYVKVDTGNKKWNNPTEKALVTIPISKGADGKYKLNIAGLEDIIADKQNTIKKINQTLQAKASKLEAAGIQLEEYGMSNAADVSESKLTSVKNTQKFQFHGNKDGTIKAVNKFITLPEYRTLNNKHVNALLKDNDVRTNMQEYSKEDTVFVTIPRESKTGGTITTIKGKDVSTLLATSNQFNNVVTAAKTARATIKLDSSMNPDVRNSLVAGLTRFGKDLRYVSLFPLKNRKNEKGVIIETVAQQYAKLLPQQKAIANTFIPFEVHKAKVEEEAKITATKKVTETKLKKLLDLYKDKEENTWSEPEFAEISKEVFSKPEDEASTAIERARERAQAYVKTKVVNEAKALTNDMKPLIKAVKKAEKALEADKESVDLKSALEAAQTAVQIQQKKIDASAKVVKDKYEETKRALEESRANVNAFTKKLKEINALDTDKENKKRKVEEAVEEIKQSLGTPSLLENIASKGMGKMYYYISSEEMGDKKEDDGKTNFSMNPKENKDRYKEAPIDLTEIIEESKGISIVRDIPADVLFELGDGKTSVEFMQSKVDYLNKVQNIAKEGKKGMDAIDTRFYELFDSPALGLVRTKDGSVNKQVAMAMLLGLGEYITFDMRALDGEFKTKEDVANMIGVHKSQVGKATQALLRDKGVFNKTAANKLGAIIANKLGIKFKSKKDNGELNNVEKEAFNKLLADLGNMTLLYAKEQGILTHKEENANAYRKARKADTDAEFISMAENDNEIIHFVSLPNKVNKEHISKVTEFVDEYKEIHEMIAEESTLRKEPSNRPIINKRHEVEQVSKDIAGLKIPTGDGAGQLKDKTSPKEYMEELINLVWKVDVSNLTKVLTDLNRDVLKKYLGYVDEDGLAKLGYYSRESAIASNREIEKSIEELQILQDKISAAGTMRADEVSTLYFDWFYTSNGRYMMDSNTINPQTDKLHRFIIQLAEHEVTYTVGKGKTLFAEQIDKNGKAKTVNLTRYVDYALAQAFGFAVDKKQTSKIDALGKALRTMNKTKFNALKVNILAGNAIEVDGVELKIEHISHAMQALTMLEQILDAKEGTEITSYLTAEFDGVTNGFAIKLMQMPIIKDVYTWLARVGIVTGTFLKSNPQNDGNSMNDILDSVGFYDSYQQLAKDAADDTEVMAEGLLSDDKGIWDSMSAVLPTITKDENGDTIISKALRTLFKDPFLTFNYAAGIKSIKASLAGKLTGEIIDGIAREDEAYDKVAKKLLSVIKIHNKNYTMENLIDDLKTKPLDRIVAKITTKKNAKGVSVRVNKSLEDVLVEIFESTYGNTVEKIMTKNFGEFIEANTYMNNAFRVMFDVFKIEYEKAKAKYPVGTWNEDAFMEVMHGENGLIEKFPLIKGPFSDSLREGVGIYERASQTVSDKDARYRTAQTKTGSDKVGEKTLKIRHMIKDFEAAISAGAVVPIHYIDGALMAQIKGVTAIHDAIMPSLLYAEDRIKDYNQNMFDINKAYGLVDEVYAMLDRITGAKYLDSASLGKATTQIKLKNEKGVWALKKDITIKEAHSEMLKLVGELKDTVAKSKEEVYNDIQKIGQMAGLPGSMWKANDEIEIEVKDTIPEDMVKLVVSLIKEAGSGMQTLVKDIITKEYNSSNTVSGTDKNYNAKLKALFEATC